MMKVARKWLPRLCSLCAYAALLKGLSAISPAFVAIACSYGFLWGVSGLCPAAHDTHCRLATISAVGVTTALVSSPVAAAFAMGCLSLMPARCLWWAPKSSDSASGGRLSQVQQLSEEMRAFVAERKHMPRHRGNDDERKLRKRWDDCLRRVGGDIFTGDKRRGAAYSGDEARFIEACRENLEALGRADEDPPRLADEEVAEQASAPVESHRPATAPGRDAEVGHGAGAGLEATSPPTSSAVTLALPGLNIRWPVSQLILAGEKTVEVRDYDLGYRRIQLANVETWLVETEGLVSNASTNAIVGDALLGPRPKKAQIVAVIVFSRAEAYGDLEEFHADRARHRIREGGAQDWTGTGRRFRWQVASVRRLVCPVPIHTGKTGWGKPRCFKVSLVPAGVAG